MTSEVVSKGSKRLKLNLFEITQNERENLASSGCVGENVIVSKTSAVPWEDSNSSQEIRQTQVTVKKEKGVIDESIIVISSDEESEKESCSTDSDISSNKSKDLPSKVKDPTSDIEPITQEALLARLGLGSVKRMNSTDNGVDGKLERKPLVDKPKPSIIEMLTVPKISSKAEKKESLEKKRASEPPVVIANGDIDKNSDDDSGDEISKHEAYISKLKEELRGEEAKLLLLRKLYSNQNEVRNNTSKHQKENVSRAQSYTMSSQSSSDAGKKVYSTTSTAPAGKLPLPPSNPSGTPIAIAPKSILPKTTPSYHKTTSVITTAVKTTGSGLTSKTSSVQQKGSVTSHVSPATTAVTLIHHPLPLYPPTNITGITVTQPSPVRPTAVYVAGGSTTYSTQYKPVAVAQPITTTTSISSSSENSASRQAAAKLALRKQLEKTLLQIPPPKPPPADWIFIPNLNSTDFTTLLGLEEVVDELSRAKENKDTTASTAEKVNIKPKLCSNCHTDFSPTWPKKPNDTSGAVVCERCDTLSVKKELKAEHTARLKAAFLKALKQEQEIEQKMNENPGIVPKLSSSQHLSASSHLPHHHQLHAQIIHHHPPTLYHHHPQQYTEPLFHQLHQRHMQHNDLEAARRSADARWHPYLSQHHRSYMSSSDRQREYLLDMIPSVPSTLSYGASRI